MVFGEQIDATPRFSSSNRRGDKPKRLSSDFQREDEGGVPQV